MDFFWLVKPALYLLAALACFTAVPIGGELARRLLAWRGRLAWRAYALGYLPALLLIVSLSVYIQVVEDAPLPTPEPDPACWASARC